MKLGFISDGSFSCALTEGYGRVKNFAYHAYGHDPRPRVLSLATYRHKGTGRKHLAGINLNYLSDAQIQALQKALPSILSQGPKDRYRIGVALLPNVFRHAYRTYDRTFVHEVTPATLKYITSPQMRKKQRAAAQKGWQTRRSKAKLAQAKKKPVVQPKAEPPKPEAELSQPEQQAKQDMEKLLPKGIQRTQQDIQPDIDLDVEKTKPEAPTEPEERRPTVEAPEPDLPDKWTREPAEEPEAERIETEEPEEPEDEEPE